MIPYLDEVYKRVDLHSFRLAASLPFKLKLVIGNAHLTNPVIRPYGDGGTVKAIATDRSDRISNFSSFMDNVSGGHQEDELS